MAQKKWVIGTAAFLAVALLLSGFVAFASELNTQSTLLVSMAYIEQEFTPSLLDKISKAVSEQSSEFETSLDDKYNRLSNELKDHIANSSGGTSSDALANDPEFISKVAAAVLAQLPASSGGDSGGSSGSGDGLFKRVDLANGKTVTLELGTEVFLRSGSAACVASGSPGLINLSTGGDLANGKNLEKSNHYVCTITGRGFKTTAEAIVFIKGGYTVS